MPTHLLEDPTEPVRVVHGQWGAFRHRDLYGSMGLFLGPVSLFSTHPVSGWGHRKPRVHSIRVGKWQLSLEQREPRPPRGSPPH